MRKFAGAILFFALISHETQAQMVRDHDGQGLRSFHGQGARIRRSFQSDVEARAVLKNILAVSGLSGMEDRILIRASAETANAEAFIETKEQSEERLIFYNAVFMQDIAKKTKDYWSMVAILAHEVGHHIRLHTVISGRDHEFELEADYHAGFILRRMGATLEQTQAAFRAVGTEEATSTHPARSQRIQMATLGWTEGSSEVFSGKPPTKTPAVEVDASLADIMSRCVSEPRHPIGGEIIKRLASLLGNRKYTYGWKKEAQQPGQPATDFANLVTSAAVHDNQLHLSYDYQQGRLMLVPTVEKYAAKLTKPGVSMQGIWIQNNGYGCLRLLVNDQTGEADGHWGVAGSNSLESPSFIRPVSAALLQALEKQAEVATPARAAKPLDAIDERSLKAGDQFRECDVCPEMVTLPMGAFMMGSNHGDTNEKPVRKVTIAKPFAVSKYEVTFFEWDGCVSGGGCQLKPDDGGTGRGNRPVVRISWEDVTTQYLPWLSRKTNKRYRLLTESEWEYAAAAGSKAQFSWGDDDIGKGKANCIDCGSPWDGKQSAPVGALGANAFGLHEMHGNVWEWVADCYSDTYVGVPSDGREASAKTNCWRVLRGGAFDTGSQALHITARGRNRANLRSGTVGFRVARTLE